MPSARKFKEDCYFYATTDFTGQAAGRHEVDEELFYFINEYETKDAEDCFWEAHRKNLNLHYILEAKRKSVTQRLNVLK
ncbi:YhcH/YjgK/YiaL family protein [Paenibacillus sp. BR2-3]|uniref:YhcH/YjgK/YiaL family protein n=1 Tax=Paenibacillus sp. BR2-3 TaxID=3048494 RepID=UPI0039778732